MKPEAVTSDAPKPIANYTEALRVGDLVFAATQLASDFKTGIPPEARTDPPSPTTAQTSNARPTMSSKT